MRRTLCAFLILSFWLGPLTAILPASAESRLPACCRRHGAHHCVMSAEMAAQVASGSAPFFAAPSHCDSYPGCMVLFTEPVQAVAASPAGLPLLLAEPHSPLASRAEARLSQIRTRASRGPPTFDIA